MESWKERQKVEERDVQTQTEGWGGEERKREIKSQAEDRKNVEAAGWRRG